MNTILNVTENNNRLVIEEPNSGFIIENLETNVLRISPATSVLNVKTDNVKFLSIGVQGPQGLVGPQGPIGPQGPQGPPGIDLYYVHTQISAQNIWTIAHNLGKKPSVTVVDSGDTEVNGLIQYLDDNNLEVIFSNPFGGKAYCN